MSSRRSVTITAAWIAGLFVLLAAIATPLVTWLLSPPRGVSLDPQPSLVRAGLEADEAAKAELSFQEYAETLERLRDRNLERDRFLKELDGRQVRWHGFVDSVSSTSLGVTLSLRAFETSPLPLANVSFSQDFATELFSFRNGDAVQVDAVYQAFTSLMPTLRGLDVARSEPEAEMLPPNKALQRTGE